jgi:hypothetical protein
MTTRQLVQAIMSYGEFDRMPVIHWTGWRETMERWVREGMPEGVNQHEYFSAVPWSTWVGGDLGLRPGFEEVVLEDTDEYRVFRDGAGVVQKEWKRKSCIPTYTDFTLKTAKDWPQYKKRLQPDPARIPADLDKRIADAEASGLPIAVGTASMMGWIRNWMGVENMCYLMFDDPDVYADMVDTLAELTCWQIDQVAPRMHTTPDWGFGWEDICGKTGPLVSPPIFQRCVAPGYLKIRCKLEQYGIHMLGIDSDGFVEPLLRNWLEAGVNLHFPIEIGTWGADTMDLRRKFGRDLHIIGGYNKLALEHGRAAIDAELQRRIPIMKDGGLVIMPDHLITPDTPLDDYKYYLDRIRQLRL